MTVEGGWTPDQLKVLLDEKLDGLDARFGAELKRIEAVIAGQERAVTLLGTANQIAQDKFEATVRDGFVKQNEFRGSLDDLGKQMATRRESEAGLLALAARFDASMLTQTARLDELAKQIVSLGSRIDIGPVGLQTLQSRVDTSQGKSSGISASIGLLISCVGLGLAVVIVLTNALS